jgi:DNA-directed RNA polymerase subunit L
MVILMEVRIMTDEKDTLELEFAGADQSLIQLMADKLNQEKSVDFAAYKVEHPLVGSPKLIVKTKKGDARKLVLEKLKEIKGEVEEFRKKFLDIVA